MYSGHQWIFLGHFCLCCPLLVVLLVIVEFLGFGAVDYNGVFPVRSHILLTFTQL